MMKLVNEVQPPAGQRPQLPQGNFVESIASRNSCQDPRGAVRKDSQSAVTGDHQGCHRSRLKGHGILRKSRVAVQDTSQGTGFGVNMKARGIGASRYAELPISAMNSVSMPMWDRTLAA